MGRRSRLLGFNRVLPRRRFLQIEFWAAEDQKGTEFQSGPTPSAVPARNGFANVVIWLGFNRVLPRQRFLLWNRCSHRLTS